MSKRLAGRTVTVAINYQPTFTAITSKLYSSLISDSSCRNPTTLWHPSSKQWTIRKYRKHRSLCPFYNINRLSIPAGEQTTSSGRQVASFSVPPA